MALTDPTPEPNDRSKLLFIVFCVILLISVLSVVAMLVGQYYFNNYF